MLHRSNAECSLWKDGGSPGRVAGQSRNPARHRAGAGTWPGAVFGPAGRRPGEREDLPGSLRYRSWAVCQTRRMRTTSATSSTR